MPKINLLRQMAGSLIYDVPRYFFYLLPLSVSAPTPSWVFVRNRNEELVTSETQLGVKCNWQWTSDLYLPIILPVFGKWLFKRALKDYPILLADKPGIDSKKPDVSFLVGHRGIERLPLLLMTLKSIAAQSDCSVECIVVEQDNEKLIQDLLPDWVRYIHTPLPDKNIPYSRSWTFNAAAREARSDCLILHDNDMLAPHEYASKILKYHREGYEFINLKRFIIFLSQSQTEKSIQVESVLTDLAPETIMQNAEGGGSIAADKKAYWEIGGFDERFLGWGGEDNEFWERANTRKVYLYGFLPLVHLWHVPQAEKHNSESDSIALYKKLSMIHVDERIKRLQAIQ